MRVSILLAVSLLATGCAGVAPGKVTGEPSLPRCNARVLGAYFGRPATAELGAAMLRATGARALRWLRPGAMMTMDFRYDRLTVRIGPDGRVAQAACN